MVVAIVGYRNYPDTDVRGQVTDLLSATNLLLRTEPHLFHPPGPSYLGPCIMGHSSGAHISLLLLAHYLEKEIDFPFFTSLVYLDLIVYLIISIMKHIEG